VGDDESAAVSERRKPPQLRLPDVLDDRVRVLLVGINPGLRSAQLGHHFAGPSNRFWKLLFSSGLVGEALTFEDDRRLGEWGLGLTNLVPRATRGIDELTPLEYAAGQRALVRRIARHEPQLVALVGVTLARVLGPSHVTAAIGRQDWTIAGRRVFVVPNPSGRNAHYSYAEMLQAFRALAEAAQAVRDVGPTPTRGLKRADYE
jgi:double-stranded uracil-DNA glycosylase